jgi:hypothetical protein
MDRLDEEALAVVQGKRKREGQRDQIEGKKKARYLEEEMTQE